MADADLFIVGSGATAFAAAIRAGDLGAKVAIAERRTIGGTCVNRGCLPSKNLLEAARAVWEARHPRFPGIAAADVEVDLPALLAQKDEVVRSYRHRKYEKVAEEIVNLDLIDGDVTIAGPHELLAEGRRYPARYLLIATGSRPDVPPIPGLDAVPYLTSDLLDADEPGRLTRLPSSLLILGGGYVAVELAQLFSRLGSRVTVLQRSRRLLSDHEPEVGLILRQVFENEGIELVTGAQVRSVDGDGDVVRVAAEVRDETRTVEAQRLLVATGRRPNSDGLGLEAIGVELDDGGAVVVDPELRTSQPWVWAAGDVIGSQAGSQMATPVGARQGTIAAENALLEAGRTFDARVLPRAVFTDPPVASVGLTDADANAAGHRCTCVATPLEFVPRAAATHRTVGVVKFVVEDGSDRVLGVTMVGDGAPEVIHEAAMALRFGARLQDFVDLVHVYPTMSEALKIGALAFTRDVSRLSCCAE